MHFGDALTGTVRDIIVAMNAFYERILSVVGATMLTECIRPTSFGQSTVSPARFALTTSNDAANATVDRLDGINSDGRIVGHYRSEQPSDRRNRPSLCAMDECATANAYRPQKWRLRLLAAAPLLAVAVGCGGGSTSGAVTSSAQAPLPAPASTTQGTIETTTDTLLTHGRPATTVAYPASGPSNAVVYYGASWQPLWNINTNPWRVNSNATGSIKMQYTGTGSIITTVDLANLTSEGVNGYPFILYGSDIFGNHIGGQPPIFPAQLSSMSSLITDINYTLAVIGTAPGDLDVGFDEWLMPSATYKGGSASAVLEVIVLPYYDFTYPPPGSLVGTIREPVTLNGTTTSMVFNEYSTGTGAGHLIIFFPSGSQISSGDVRFDLLRFMNAGAATGGVSSSWYLAGIELGTEFGHATSADYTLTTKKIKIEQHFKTSM